MSNKIRIHRGGELIAETTAAAGETMLAVLGKADIFLDAPCGGRGRCGKCKIRLTPDGEEVKACDTRVDGDADIYLPDETVMKIADDGASVETSAAAVSPQTGQFGVAIDIGTTTCVAHLTNLATRERVATTSGVNAQRPYGADVISRIEYSVASGHETLTRLIQTQINGLVSDACEKAGVSPRDVHYISIAGNTIMQHLAAGYSPAGMGTVPFEPVSLFGEELPVWAGLDIAPDAVIYYAPCISSYVGGDITAGMLACDFENDAGPTVFIDIGTNGEIAMKNSDGGYLCCATAAGPAFEGAEISCGMAAVTGAVSHISWGGDGIEMTVIGEVEPDGFCGSGLLDALAMLLDTGAVDETGRLLDSDEYDHPISAHIGEVEGKNAFFLSRDKNVYVSAADIRKLQLAKAAIAAGIQTLLHTAGIGEDDVATFILAGGFGTFLDRRSAARIGLYPPAFLEKTRGMGNTAGEGAALALVSADARKTLEDIRRSCEYVELSTSIVFNEQFVEQMMFEE